MTMIIGSARGDERGKITGGKVGDQKQTSSANDTKGEVSMQTFYVSSKGWYILRPKSIAHAKAMASLMKKACNNPNLGYDQSNRLGVIKYGIETDVKTECDCSSLVRACVKEATGRDPGNFNTATEVDALLATKLFDKITYVSRSKTPIYNGDVIVTKTKGHTCIVVSGRPRKTTVEKVTAREKARSFKNSVAGTYVVTGSVNVRDGAGTKANKYGKYKTVLVTIPKGTKVKNYGYYTTVGVRRWLYAQFTYNSVVYTGFISSKYLKKEK